MECWDGNKIVGEMMKKYIAPVVIAVFLFGISLSACNFPTQDNPPISAEQAIHTAAAKTVIAIATERAGENPAGAGTPALSDQVTSTPPASAGQPGDATSTASTQDADAPCDRARFVQDISVPDNTLFAPGTSFTKTWRLRNAGTCTWTTAYRVVFDSGDSMSAPASVNLPHNVLPGDTVDVSVSMLAPNEQRSYTGYWKMENASGTRFGTGDGNKAFWLKVVVGTTPVPFAVTAARVVPENSNISASCPYRYNFTINITTTAPGKVTYFLERSDGKKTETRSLEFTEAGTRSASVTWEFPASFTGSVRVYNDEPNHQYFPPVNIALNCY
jgi:hypothetical protein